MLARYKRLKEGARSVGTALRWEARQHVHPITLAVALLFVSYIWPMLGLTLIFCAGCVAYSRWSDQKYQSQVAAYADSCVKHLEEPRTEK